MGKTSHKVKPLPGDFQVTTPKNPLINNQMVSIRNLTTTLAYRVISNYNWTFIWIPNCTWYYKDFFLCMDPSMCLTSQQMMFVVGCKFLHFKGRWRSGNTWLENPKVYKNAVPSPGIYKFSYLSLCVFDDLKKGFISSKSLVNETLAIQVIMGWNSQLRILDLHSLIDRRCRACVKNSSLSLDRCLCQD